MDYRILLQRELARRQAVNPRFSLRSFARLLKMNPGYLSRVLRGEQTLSSVRARKVAQALGYSESLSDEFVASAREASRQASRPKHQERSTVALDQFELIADWFHFPLLDLTTTADFTDDPAWIAARLGISEADATQAIERLLRLGHLTRDPETGVPRKAERHLATPSDIPSVAIRQAHVQLIEKAKTAIESKPVDERDFSAMTLAIDPSLVPLAKEEIKAFRRRLADLLSSKSDSPSAVFQLGVQFFEITHPISSVERK